ncbi:MAG: hypothetical protein HY744_20760 [Deltaproteobacteria bacterium]|nr:hypothetical protein [Deltaproteobacteria bacterium]
MSRKWVPILALGLVMAPLAGCAEEREPINRVQANALAKSFFVGPKLLDPSDDPEFWNQASLIDVGYGAAQDGLFTSTWAQAVARVKWQITEDLLFGRLPYERVQDSDGKGAGAASTDGQVVVAFRILSHFDIKRAYNPSTGEELNVVEENTTDRPWYEREYFRVDWSKNLISTNYDLDTVALLGIYGGVTYEPTAYYVNDPTDRDAPFFDVQSGYFDITNKLFATPRLIDLSSFGWGIDSFPACYLPNDFLGGSDPYGNCNAVELTVRQAFRRVVDTDFEPIDWDGYRFQAYGGFYVDRYGYDRQYGMSDYKWHRFLTHYNIWERTHYYQNSSAMTGPVECYTRQSTPVGADPHRDADQNGTEDECEAVTDALASNAVCPDPSDPGCQGLDAECQAQGIADPAQCDQLKRNICCHRGRNRIAGGSRCDTFKQRCTLPYRYRKVLPLAWYYTTLSNPEFFDGTDWAAHEWDVAMRHAQQAANYGECMATRGDPASCAEEYPVYFGQMDDAQEARDLATEIDACRRGKAYAGRDCNQLADELGQQRGLEPGVIALAKMPEAIVVCHSPVQADDPGPCGGPRLPKNVTAEQCYRAEKERDGSLLGTCRAARNARRGDLRYHLINALPEPQEPSSWGIYTDAEDPMTGEKFSAAINVWTHVNDLWSQMAVDRLRFIKGEFAPEDITEAEYARDWVTAADAADHGGIGGHLTRQQVRQRVAAFTGVKPEQLDLIAQKKLDPGVVASARKLRDELQQVRAAVDAPSTMTPIYDARRRQVVGSPLEAELVTPMMQQYAGVEDLAMTPAMMQYASPLRGLNPSVRRHLRNFQQAALAEHGACILYEAPAPLAMTGLADVVERKFGPFGARCEDWDTGCKTAQRDHAERIRRYVANRVHYGVIVHEMGHSIALRHNFVSSSDAWGYRPQYWQLRTNNGAVTKLCEDYTPEGESCVGPRYFDPITKNERDNLLNMWQHSTTMDYAGEYAQDLVGLSAWDYASAAMFYGQMVPVFADESYKVGQPRATGMLAKMDNFGGIVGIQPQYGTDDIHYSDLQNKFELIKDCREIPDPALWKPATWNEARDGIWDPVLDGFIVSVGGKYSKCRQQRVDYVPWQKLHFPSAKELKGVNYYRGGPSIDALGRVRVPYGFATDRWADLGNASVYRHDNGADVFEIFDFLITQQEVHHIFDNYRRGRQSFSVRSASDRILSRYHEKIRDGAKGLGLMTNVYRDFAMENGWVFDGGFWPFIAGQWFSNNIIASTMTFDHFVRSFARPEPGPHYLDDAGILRSEEDAYVNNPSTAVLIPNGATGYFGNVTSGGKLIENRLCEHCGEFDADFTMNSGSYYDKVWTPYLMAESVDNFISDSRGDFVDGRYRAVSLADLFPDGYRRWLGNNLTGDDALKGPQLAANKNGAVLRDEKNYPLWPIGWVSYWPEQPEVCFPASGTPVCGSVGLDSKSLDPQMPERTVPLDPQVDFEVQKFLIAYTILYLPSNERQDWINQLRLWELGTDADPGFKDRIELHDPTGKIFVAKVFGKETIFGKSVQKGIAARMLEYANELLEQGYEVDPGPDNDGDDKPDWWIPRINPETGKANVKWTSTMQFVDENGMFVKTIPGCDGEDNSKCPCSANPGCVKLQKYVSVPFFLRQAIDAYGIANPEKRGIWEL